MATSAIYAPDEEAQRKYQEALDRVTQSLDARKNRLFDPVLLAMAEGFLAPTRTGSFGESLGIAAGKLRGAEEARAKEDQELAKAQLELAQQGMQLQRQRQMSQAYEQALKPGLNAPSAASPAGAPGVSVNRSVGVGVRRNTRVSVNGNTCVFVNCSPSVRINSGIGVGIYSGASAGVNCGICVLIDRNSTVGVNSSVGCRVSDNAS